MPPVEEDVTKAQQEAQATIDPESVVVPLESLGSTPIEFPRSTPSSSLTTEGILEGARRFSTQATTDVENARGEVDTSETTVRSLQDVASTRGATTLEAERVANLPERRQELQDILGVITQRTNALDRARIEDDRQVLGLEGQGRGIPLDIIQGQQRALQREQNFARRAEASEIGALVATAELLRGNIQTAQDTIDRTIDLKFGDLERQIDTELTFLERNDDRLSSAEKKASDARKEKLQTEKELIQQQRQDEQRKFDLVSDAAKSGATAQELTAIQRADTLEEANELSNQIVARRDQESFALERRQREAAIRASQASTRASRATTELREFELATKQDAQKAIEEARANGELIVTDEQADKAATLRSEFEKLTKESDFINVTNSYNRIDSLDDTAAGDLALIFNYMKMLDPGSVVRESEFATAQNSAGVPDRIRAQYNRVLSGERLAPNTRADFLQQADNLYNSSLQNHRNLENRYRDLSDTLGVPQQIVVRTIRSNKYQDLKLQVAPEEVDTYDSMIEEFAQNTSTVTQ